MIDEHRDSPPPGALGPRVLLAATFARRRLSIMLLVLGAVVAAGVALAVATPAWYEATTTLWVNPKADDALQQADGLLSRYYLQRIESNDVLGRAAKALKSGTAPTLSRQVDVGAVRGTNIISITGRGATREEAVAIANAVAQAAIEQNRADVDARTDARLEALTADSTQVDAALANAVSALAIEGGDGPVAARQSAVDQLRVRATRAFNDLRDLEAQRETASTALSVLEAATPPEGSAGPSLPFYLAVSAVLGVIAAVAVGILLERVQDTMWTQAALRRAIGNETPVVRVARATDAATPEQSTFGVAYAQLRARTDIQTVMVVPVSSSDDDAARWVANGLGSADRAARAVPVVSRNGNGTANGNGHAPADLAVLVSPTHGFAAAPSDVDAVVFVARAGYSRFEDAEAARALARGAASLGVLVVN